MYYYEVAPTHVFVHLTGNSLTYHSDQKLQPGQLVMVEVHQKQLAGLILSETTKPTYPTKPITKTIEQRPLPPALLTTIIWMSHYYMSPLSAVLSTVLPHGVGKKRRALVTSPAHVSVRNRTTIVLNKEQRQAIHTIETMSPGSALLHGVTGSGKTEVYLELAKQTIAHDQSVIVLIPEIALTSQLVDEFSRIFPNVVITNSHQTESERHQLWQKMLVTDEPVIIIGPRSALFAPLYHLGLIVIDEAHEPGYKQEQSPRYSALRTASILAKAHQAKLILGSATPTITDYYLAKYSKRPIITMNTRAISNVAAPTIQLIDMTKRAHFSRHRFFSNELLDQLEQNIKANRQSLIFHNRRGTASTTLCEHCGWWATCPRCFTPLTLHANRNILLCYICNYSEPVPTSCPVCHQPDIIHKGIGTQLIETELHKLFPDQIIARFDRDTEATDSLENRYKSLYEGDIKLIVGTQIIAKGLDLPHLATVGVIQADAGLRLPDFGATERTFQLLAQVVGRVGRTKQPTSIIVQSYQPNHPAISLGIKQDYAAFYAHTLIERQKGHFPPFTHLLKLTCLYTSEAEAVRHARAFAVKLRHEAPKTVEVLGPTPAFYERQRTMYYWQLLLKSPVRADLAAIVGTVPSAHWRSELDPVSLL